MCRGAEGGSRRRTAERAGPRRDSSRVPVGPGQLPERATIACCACTVPLIDQPPSERHRTHMKPQRGRAARDAAAAPATRAPRPPPALRRPGGGSDTWNAARAASDAGAWRTRRRTTRDLEKPARRSRHYWPATPRSGSLQVSQLRLSAELPRHPHTTADPRSPCARCGRYESKYQESNGSVPGICLHQGGKPPRPWSGAVHRSGGPRWLSEARDRSSL